MLKEKIDRIIKKVRYEMGIMEKVPVMANDEVIARVEYISNLDSWNSGKWYCDDIGHHRGIQKIQKGYYAGRYVMIRGSDYEGEEDYGELMSTCEALREIYYYKKFGLLEEYNFQVVDFEKIILFGDISFGFF